MNQTTSDLEINDNVLIRENLVLTTVDNPFNPHTHYEAWRVWDADHGYYTEEFIGRVANIPVDVDLDNDWLINTMTTLAVQSILDNDVLGIYKLI